MVTINSTFNAKTYRAFFRYDAYIANQKAKLLWALMIIAAAIGLYGLIAGNSQWMWVGIIVFVAMPIIYFLSTESKMRKNIRLAKLDTKPYEVQFESSDKKIITLNKRTNKFSSFKWAEIEKVCRTGKYLFLYVNKTQAIVINKADMQSGDEEKILAWADAVKAERQELNEFKRKAEAEAKKEARRRRRKNK